MPALRRLLPGGGRRRELLSIAPMMDVTDRHYRNFMRRLTRRTQLWTEMVVDDTILHQEHNLDRFLYFEAEQHPIVAQLGGSNPETLARAADPLRGVRVRRGQPQLRLPEQAGEPALLRRAADAGPRSGRALRQSDAAALQHGRGHGEVPSGRRRPRQLRRAL